MTAARPTLETFPRVLPVLPSARQRAILAEAVPGAAEAVYPGWKLIGYRLADRPGGRYFAFVAPQTDRVRLGFEHGVRMADPHRVLEGDGTQVRYVKVRPDDEIDAEQLALLVREAARVATEPKPRTPKSGGGA